MIDAAASRLVLFVGLRLIHGLTPIAKRCHRFAIKSEHRVLMVFSGEAAIATSCGR
jgi:hypothetical protein